MRKSWAPDSDVPPVTYFEQDLDVIGSFRRNIKESLFKISIGEVQSIRMRIVYDLFKSVFYSIINPYYLFIIYF